MRLPERIQRRRAKGWTMPRGVVYVGRGTKWGNPFVVGEDGTREECIANYIGLFYGMLCVSVKDRAKVKAQERVIAAMQKDLRELRGRKLACWCRPDQRCHADVLLHLANKKRLPMSWMPRYESIG